MNLLNDGKSHLIQKNINVNYYREYLKEKSHSRNLRSYSADLINFSANDYLGLSTHPVLIERVQQYAALNGAGGVSSRLVTGNISLYETLEAKLADALQKPSALIMGPGYQTNIAVLEALLDPAILGREPQVFCDRLCHASLMMGSRYHARMLRFRHNDVNHLRQLLERNSNSDVPKFILVESLYSMDGDFSDLKKIIDLAREFNAFLYVDDAHAVGVYGPNGWGKAAEYPEGIDLIMGTFSKALGSYGAYVACSTEIKDYLINKCKGLIYSTALPPPVLGAIEAAIDLLPTLEKERQILLSQSESLREFFRAERMNHGASRSHIIPWIIGDAEQALKISAMLETEGIIGIAIRPPSVPVGQSRIRFCISAKHGNGEIEQLKTALLKIRKVFNNT